MPEGPETKRMADSISKSLVGKDIVSHKFYHKDLLRLNKDKHFSVIHAFSQGKAVIIRLTNGLSIISHNQLYGKWTFHRPNTVVKTNRQLRIEFVTKTKVVRLWSATDIKLLKTEKETSHPYLNRIGPDILDDRINHISILERLNNKRFFKRRFSYILLDQSFISGLGNYLRSEILFFSNLNHELKSSELNENQLLKFSKAIKYVSVRAYKQKGKTIDFEIIRKTFGNADNFKKIKHMVFRRDGQPCFMCGSIIIKVIVASRRIFICPSCQTYE